MQCEITCIDAPGQAGGRTVAVSADDDEISAAGFICHIAQRPLYRGAPFYLAAIMLHGGPKALFRFGKTVLQCDFSGGRLLPIVWRLRIGGCYSDQPGIEMRRQIDGDSQATIVGAVKAEMNHYGRISHRTGSGCAAVKP